MKACLNEAAVNFEEDDDGQSDYQSAYFLAIPWKYHYK